MAKVPPPRPPSLKSRIYQRHQQDQQHSHDWESHSSRGDPPVWIVNVDPEKLEWSTEKRTMRQFYECYEYNLPLILRVNSGFDGIDGFHTFSTGDVYFACGTYSQPRVLVKDERQRTISIPRNYAGTFDIVASNGRPPSDNDKELTLTEVAQRWRVSIEKFTVVQHGDTAMRALVELSGENTEKLGQLTIVDVYDEVSFVVHSILRANVLCQRPCLIPLYVDIEVVVCKGVLNGSVEQHTKLIGELKQLVDTLPPSTDMQVNNEIIIFEGDMRKGDYCYALPSAYAKLPDMRCSAAKSSVGRRTPSSSDNALPPPLPARPLNGQLPLNSITNGSATSRQSAQSRVPPVLVNRTPSTRTSPQSSTSNNSNAAAGRGSHHHYYNVSVQQGIRNISDVTPAHQNQPPLTGKSDQSIITTNVDTDSVDRIFQQPVTSATMVAVDDASYASLADVPRKVEYMTCDQLASAVRLIFPKRPQYAEALLEEEVDGAIAQKISQETFVTDLGFNTIDAIKMVHFLEHGWKPVRNRDANMQPSNLNHNTCM